MMIHTHKISYNQAGHYCNACINSSHIAPIFGLTHALHLLLRDQIVIHLLFA